MPSTAATISLKTRLGNEARSVGFQNSSCSVCSICIDQCVGNEVSEIVRVIRRPEAIGRRAEVHSRWRAAAEGRKVLVDASTKLRFGQHAAVVRVPRIKPLQEALGEFSLRDRAILV